MQNSIIKRGFRGDPYVGLNCIDLLLLRLRKVVGELGQRPHPSGLASLAVGPAQAVSEAWGPLGTSRLRALFQDNIRFLREDSVCLVHPASSVPAQVLGTYLELKIINNINFGQVQFFKKIKIIFMFCYLNA